jgi:hypothetical protein
VWLSLPAFPAPSFHMDSAVSCFWGQQLPSLLPSNVDLPGLQPSFSAAQERVDLEGLWSKKGGGMS